MDPNAILPQPSALDMLITLVAGLTGLIGAITILWRTIMGSLKELKAETTKVKEEARAAVKVTRRNARRVKARLETAAAKQEQKLQEVEGKVDQKLEGVKAVVEATARESEAKVETKLDRIAQGLEEVRRTADGAKDELVAEVRKASFAEGGGEKKGEGAT